MDELLIKLQEKLDSDDLTTDEIYLVENFVRENFNTNGTLAIVLKE